MNPMKKRILAFGMILLVVINASALVTLSYNRWFKTQKQHPQAVPEETLTAMQTRLCLDDDQLNQMRHVRTSFESESGEIRAKMLEKNKELVTELKKTSPDRVFIEQLIEEINHLQCQVQKKAVSCLIQEKKILNPEQQEKFLKMFEDHVCPRGDVRSHQKTEEKNDCQIREKGQSTWRGN